MGARTCADTKDEVSKHVSCLLHELMALAKHTRLAKQELHLSARHTVVLRRRVGGSAFERWGGPPAQSSAAACAVQPYQSCVASCLEIRAKIQEHIDVLARERCRRATKSQCTRPAIRQGGPLDGLT